MVAAHFDPTAFRASLPAFANAAQWPDEALASWWATGALYISPDNANFAQWGEAQAQRACDLMCAHLCTLWQKTQAGAPLAVITSGSEGSVSVSLQPPPIKSMFDHWLAQSPYGIELAMLLELVAAAGLVVGGSPQLAAFRGPYGYPIYPGVWA